MLMRGFAPDPHPVVAEPGAQVVVERLDHRVAGDQHPQPAAAVRDAHVAGAHAPRRAGAQPPGAGPREPHPRAQRVRPDRAVLAAARAAGRPDAELDRHIAEPPAVGDLHAHRPAGPGPARRDEREPPPARRRAHLGAGRPPVRCGGDEPPQPPVAAPRHRTPDPGVGRAGGEGRQWRAAGLGDRHGDPRRGVQRQVDVAGLSRAGGERERLLSPCRRGEHQQGERYDEAPHARAAFQIRGRTCRGHRCQLGGGVR